MDAVLMVRFPINTNDKEFYISYQSILDDDQMQKVYKAHNMWMKEVEVISMGMDHNIDCPYEVGLQCLVSLREFIHHQPADPHGFHFPMGAKNGGTGNRSVLIILPKYRKAAKQTLDDFCDLTRKYWTKDKVPGMKHGPRQNQLTLDEEELAQIDRCLNNMTIKEDNMDYTEQTEATLTQQTKTSTMMESRKESTAAYFLRHAKAKKVTTTGAQSFQEMVKSWAKEKNQ